MILSLKEMDKGYLDQYLDKGMLYPQFRARIIHSVFMSIQILDGILDQRQENL